MQDRPRTRGDCKNAQRPCRWVSCKYHLILDVNDRTGSLKINFDTVDEMVETCCLDVADKGGATLKEVGDLLNLTRERIRQLEVKALLVVEQAKLSVED